MMVKRKIIYKNFMYSHQHNHVFQEAADFATLLGNRLITITGHGDVYTDGFGNNGQVVVWYYEENKDMK